MKKIIAMAFLALTLSACGGNDAPAAAPKVTGTWDGKLVYLGTDLAVFTGQLNQSDSPNAGDYTGALTLSTGGTLNVIGNVAKGTLNGIEGGGSMLCNGTFSNANRYDAICAFSYQGRNASINLAMTKR